MLPTPYLRIRQYLDFVVAFPKFRIRRGEDPVQKGKRGALSICYWPGHLRGE